MHPTIPFTFSPSADEFDQHHLEYTDVPDGQLVRWPLTGATITVPSFEWSPEFDHIEKANGDLIRFHGLTGFSIGSYHEFLVSELPSHMGIKMGTFEVTFGEASPLMAYLFQGLHREKYFGLWDQITTARIVGVPRDEVEVVFINAAIRYNELFGSLPRTFSMDESLLFSEEPETSQPTVLSQDPAVRDIDPVRFLYHGISQVDDAAACLYFYRVLEYYSFLSNKKQMNSLRHDSSVSEDEFAKQILQLITKDEKGPLLKLVNAIADDVLIKQAVTASLVKSADSNFLGESIYAFRNSIVHGKQSYGYTLQSSSVLAENILLPAWRAVLQGLAKRAIHGFGSKLL